MRTQQYFPVGPSVEQVQCRDRGFFRFFDLWFGQLNATHGNHSADSKVSYNAAYTKPERPVQTVIQDHQDKEILLIVRHPLSQAVVSESCQKTQNPQGTKESCKREEEGSQGDRTFCDRSESQKSLLHTSDGVPQVEPLVSFDALVGNLACVVDAERQADESKAHSHQQKKNHHHVKASIQCLHKLWENWSQTHRQTVSID